MAYASDAFGPFIGAVESAVVSSGQVDKSRTHGASRDRILSAERVALPECADV